MIYAFTGKTGSGKTYQMIRHIYPHWYKGVDVYSNTKLLFEKYGGRANSNIIDNPENFTVVEKVFDKIKKYYAKYFKKVYTPKRRGRIIYFEDITEILEARNGIICMDEGQNLLEARNWESMPVEFSNKLRQHRKHKLDLYTTTQNLGTIDINYRRLVQRWFHCTEVFALLGLRNPSWLTIHRIDEKDIDSLYNNVDDMLVEVLRSNFFIIHKFKKRIYDTMYDIGFTFYTTIWIQENKENLLLIVPKSMNLSSVRQHLLLQKFFLDLTKSNTQKRDWKNSKKN